MDLINNLSDRLLFAVPKKGRLHEQCIALLRGADINFHRHNRLDIALVQNLPIAIVFLPAADIAKYVGEGNVDMGITGQDMIFESQVNDKIDEILELGFGKCKLQVQAPVKGGATKVEELVGKRIVTSFEALAGKYFGELDEKYLSEKERKAGCKTRIQYAILIRSKNPSNPSLSSKIAARIKGVIAAQKYVLLNYNISRAGIKEATKITPGRQAPTISPLEDGEWVEIQSMVSKDEVAEIMDKLEEIGAKDILVFRIDN
ncbi:7748_t:CDS:2, partial [Acaulospora colombiana]